jgi:hypothetical protein
MYVTPNFKSKKDFKAAVAAGRQCMVFSPGPFPAPTQGRTCIEGPHYPEAHRWYAECEIKDGIVVKVK